MTFDVEFTDLFGGAANYSWVRRYQIQAASFKQALRKARELYGIRDRSTLIIDCGDFRQYNFRNRLVTCFITAI